MIRISINQSVPITCHTGVVAHVFVFFPAFLAARSRDPKWATGNQVAFSVTELGKPKGRCKFLPLLCSVQLGNPWDFQGAPRTWDPLQYSYYSQYHSYIRIPKDMGMVWEYYGKLNHKGVPIIGSPWNHH